ncbi:MAG: tRNA lysidine(34) synthetase TilS [Pseudomonadota bacterium]|nr:tRNA lysidine(34) synthetase TilS [Pseudomonadota bacterium]
MSLKTDEARSNLKITQDEFADLMEFVGLAVDRDRVAIAVSGGPDSTALFILLREWALARKILVTVLTVDHGLRNGSAEEAQRVGRFCSRFGVDHEILPWVGPKLDTCIQASAREARYELMEGWCANNGVRELYLGHTLDDQAETFLLRMAHGSGLDGLAAMPLVRWHGKVRIVRPLLRISRKRILATLVEENLSFICDPSNHDRRFARVLIREEIERLNEHGISTSAISGVTRILGRIRKQNEIVIADLFRQMVVLYPEGYAELDVEQWRQLDRVLGSRLIAELLRIIGGGIYLPRRERLNRLVAVLSTQTRGARTLGGCVISFRGLTVRIWREYQKINEVIPITPGTSVLWDRRFELCFNLKKRSIASNIYVRSMGENGWVRLLDNVNLSQKVDSLKKIPGPVRYALPAVWRGKNIVEVPDLSWSQAENLQNFIQRARFKNKAPLQILPFWVA